MENVTLYVLADVLVAATERIQSKYVAAPLAPINITGYDLALQYQLLDIITGDYKWNIAGLNFMFSKNENFTPLFNNTFVTEI